MTHALQAEQHGRVEVVGTVHFSDAVRRLAKAVVLGLKAQQVPQAPCNGMPVRQAVAIGVSHSACQLYAKVSGRSFGLSVGIE